MKALGPIHSKLPFRGRPATGWQLVGVYRDLGHAGAKGYLANLSSAEGPLMKLLDLGGDPRELTGYNGRAYYRLATITWSEPEVWDPAQRCFPVPAGWAGHGGVYAFTRLHWRQRGKPRVAYVGKAKSFAQRLTNTHNHFDIVKRRGATMVSCGRIAFDRIRSRVGHYLEIEDIIKFALLGHLENTQGFESLPGFRPTQPKAMVPWVIQNEGHLFGGIMPKRIVYPSIAVEYRIRQRN